MVITIITLIVIISFCINYHCGLLILHARRSLELARGWEGVRVSERDVSMPEVATAARAGRLIEAFATGTAAVISPVRAIRYRYNCYTNACKRVCTLRYLYGLLW